MRRFIYISRSLIGMDAEVLASILATSVTLNERCGITGMLWWSADTFVQVLEGPSEAVNDTMGRIAADPRHTDIEIVEDREASSRIFGCWSMNKADDSEGGIAATSYLVGFCAGRRTDGAQKLADFLWTQA
jgi:hypothetical protein